MFASLLDTFLKNSATASHYKKKIPSDSKNFKISKLINKALSIGYHVVRPRIFTSVDRHPILQTKFPHTRKAIIRPIIRIKKKKFNHNEERKEKEQPRTHTLPKHRNRAPRHRHPPTSTTASASRTSLILKSQTLIARWHIATPLHLHSCDSQTRSHQPRLEHSIGLAHSFLGAFTHSTPFNAAQASFGAYLYGNPEREGGS